MLRLDSRSIFAAACLMGVVLVVLIYLPGLPGAFVFDDLGNIVQNPAIQLSDLGPTSLLQALLSSPGGGLLRPISMLSFALDAYFFGISPFAFKLTNIFIHLGCGVTLGFVARELLRAYGDLSGRPLQRRETEWLSLGVTLIWCVHPLDLTAVLYAVQRDTSLAGLFSALAILAYLVARRRQREERNAAWLLWLWCPLAMAAAVLSKENGALVPVFLLVIEFTLLRFRGRTRTVDRQVLGFFGLFLLLPGLGIGVLIVLHPAMLFASYAGRDYGMAERLLTESRVLLDYLRWALLPDLRQLGLYHDDIAASRGLLQPVTTLISSLAIAALLATAVAVRRRLPLLCLGLLWFFAGHLMESTVLPLELAFEHRNYLPLFGLLFGIIGSLYLLARERGEARLVATMVVIGITAMAAATAVRASDWHTELDFARSESRHHPASPRALAELEWAYMTYIVARRDTSLIPTVEDVAQRSKAADGHSINQDISLAYMYSRLGDLPNASRHLDIAAEGTASAHSTSTLQFSLQTLLEMAVPANEPLFPQMTAIFHDVLATPQLNAESCYTANTLNTFALFQDRAREIPAALAAMHKAVSICPTNGQIRANYARLLLRYGDLKDARMQLDSLHAIGDMRRRAELQELETAYAAQLGRKPAD